jgi:hypothetical protein
MAQSDAKSYFYQFQMDAEVQEMFGSTVVEGRGILRSILMEKMPMGFS